MYSLPIDGQSVAGTFEAHKHKSLGQNKPKLDIFYGK